MNANVSSQAFPSNGSIPSQASIQLSDRQYQYLQDFIQRYNQKTKTSKARAQAYRHALADNRLSGGLKAVTKEMHYPIVGTSSQGSKIWDIDGNEYVDFHMGFGVNLLGHQPSFVIEALQEQLHKGIQLGPQAELVGEVAEQIAELTGMERVTFSNTGTEAVMTAIRLARATTGRKKIVLFAGSYHGHFDGTLVENQTNGGQSKTLPKAPGVLQEFVQDVFVLNYDNPQSLEFIESHANELAAVLVEPVQTQNPHIQPKSFLQKLRKITKESGIVFIFDEMVTGFRIHPGGAQAWFDVRADLATYGKIVGGGMPIGVIAGKSDCMDKIDGGMWQYGDDSLPQVKTTFFAGTYCKHPLAMAAARAILHYLKAQGPALQQQLNQRTEHFVRRLNECFAEEELPIQMTNFGSFFGAIPGSKPSTFNKEKLPLELLRYHLPYRDILLRGSGGFVSTAHTESDFDCLIQAIQNSIAELREGDFLPQKS